MAAEFSIASEVIVSQTPLECKLVDGAAKGQIITTDTLQPMIYVYVKEVQSKLAVQTQDTFRGLPTQTPSSILQVYFLHKFSVDRVDTLFYSEYSDTAKAISNMISGV